MEESVDDMTAALIAPKKETKNIKKIFKRKYLS